MKRDQHCKFHKVRFSKTWAEAVYATSGYLEPVFTSLENARKGLRTAGIMICPVMGVDCRSISIVVQLERKKGERPFSFLDETVIRNLCNVLSFRIDFDGLHSQLRSRDAKYASLLQTLTGLLSAKSQIELIRAMREHLPRFHGFEDLGVLFYDLGKNQLYTLYENPLLPGSSVQVASFPPSIGICGEIVGDPKIWTNGTRCNQLFNSDIDNIPSKKEVRTFMFGPLFNGEGKLNAILQLVNKLGKEEVTERDIAQFQHMGRLYGLMVERIMEKATILHTLVGLRGSANSLSGMVTADEKSEGNSQIARMIKPMRAACNLISDMMTPRRAVVLEELSAATQRNKLQHLI